jgi:hypothetical protein
VEGKVTDFGDLVHIERWLVKGRRSAVRWRVGVPVDTVQDDRVVTGPDVPGGAKGTVQMDLQADKKVTLTLEWTDEMGNPAGAPDSSAVAFTVDNPSIVNLTDNGDGTATAAAVGALGQATVHVEATGSGVGAVTGDLAINVVAGLAERVNIVAGTPEEVTPDGA